MGDFILAIDQGTTSSRTIIFDQNFDSHEIFQTPVTLFYPHNGWVEQDALAVWHGVRDLILQSIKTGRAIKTIGITNQRETIIVWDRLTGLPLAPAIVWQDQRTASICEHLKSEGYEQTVREKTGLRLDPYFSGTKLAWLIQNNPEVQTAIQNGSALCGTMDCWILWNLTGRNIHATDATNASRTLLYNIHSNEWDKDLLTLFKIPESILPRVLNSTDDFGMLDKELFGAEIPISGMAGDQQAALIGQTCFKQGEMKATYGTGCFALLNIGDRAILSHNQLLTTIAYRIGSKTCYALEGSIFIAGAGIQFLRDQLQFFDHSSDSELIALNAPANHTVYFVPALTGLGAPYWNSDIRGAIFGLTRDTTIGHITRATLEAQAYQTYDLIQSMKDDAGTLPSILRVDGGLVQNKFMCQYLADILNCDVDVPVVTESTALGAAMLAALGSGMVKDLDELQSIRKTGQLFKPNMSEDTRTQRLKGWHDHIQQLLYAPK
jgi:glycerol kinase